MRGRTAKGNELSPAKMPLMRIRSVEIVFEDEMSTCTDTAILDRSIELIVSDSSDDSTKCVDDLEHLQAERDDVDDSVTLNAEADLSDDNSISMKEQVDESIADPTRVNDRTDRSLDEPRDHACLTLANDENTLSLNISEMGDSGRYTEDACSSHVEVPILTYDDALLSHSFDVVNVDETSTVMSMYELSEVSADVKRLYEYVDSNSESSDNTAVCDGQSSDAKLTSLPDTNDFDDQSLCDSSDLQYDSFVDMGKF